MARTELTRLPPRVIRRRAEPSPPNWRRRGGRGPPGSGHDFPMLDRGPLVANPNGSIPSLFHREGLARDPFFNLVKMVVMRDRCVLMEPTGSLQTQNAVEIPASGNRTVQIGRLGRLDLKTLIVPGQILRQKSVGLGQSGNPLQSHFFNQPVLKGQE